MNLPKISRCYYEVLGLESDCTIEDIKRQYKKLSL
jgi:curved DNA-binding protein CbpA